MSGSGKGLVRRAQPLTGSMTYSTIAALQGLVLAPRFAMGELVGEGQGIRYSPIPVASPAPYSDLNAAQLAPVRVTSRVERNAASQLLHGNPSALMSRTRYRSRARSGWPSLNPPALP